MFHLSARRRKWQPSGPGERLRGRKRSARRAPRERPRKSPLNSNVLGAASWPGRAGPGRAACECRDQQQYCSASAHKYAAELRRPAQVEGTAGQADKRTSGQAARRTGPRRRRAGPKERARAQSWPLAASSPPFCINFAPFKAGRTHYLGAEQRPASGAGPECRWAGWRARRRANSSFESEMSDSIGAPSRKGRARPAGSPDRSGRAAGRTRGRPPAAGSRAQMPPGRDRKLIGAGAIGSGAGDPR